MCEQQAKQTDEQRLDAVVKEHFSSLQSFEPSEQNYILISLRDMLYKRRLHEIEEMEVAMANHQSRLKNIKQCNAEISSTKL